MNDRATTRELFRQQVRQSLDRANIAFRGKYSEQIEGLLGLSREEIDEITPDNSDLEAYDKLLEVVKEASRQNVEMSELKDAIHEIGSVAGDIAKRVSSLSVFA